MRIERKGSDYAVFLDENQYLISEIRMLAGTVCFTLNGIQKVAWVAQDKECIYVAIGGENYVFEKEKARTSAVRSAVGEKGNHVVSQMPGLLVKVPVTVGEKITTGTTLAIVEAMNMQNELRSPRDGIVKKINFKEGEQVDAFVPIVELEI